MEGRDRTTTPWAANLVVQSVALCFVVAFASIWWQSPGLYGSPPSVGLDGVTLKTDTEDPVGLLPFGPFLKRVLQHVSGSSGAIKALASTPERLTLEQASDREVLWKAMVSWPTLMWLAPSLHLLYEELFEVLCLIGFWASLLVVFLPHKTPLSGSGTRTVLLAVSWVCYLSLFKVGQTFLTFQWDVLLLEAGFFCLPLCASLHSPRLARLALWSIRWLLFRLMFASGVVKLTSNCPTWWGLTALTYHYETQCIPSAFAWFAHQLPLFVQKLSVALTLVIEALGPFLFLLPNSISTSCDSPRWLSPLLRPRNFGALLQIGLQALIAMTGNYAWFNFLTAALAVSLMDDDAVSILLFRSRNRRRNHHRSGGAPNDDATRGGGRTQAPPSKWRRLLFNSAVGLFYLVLLFGITFYLFPVTYRTSASFPFIHDLNISTGFTRTQLNQALTVLVPVSCLLFGAVILVKSLMALIEPWQRMSNSLKSGRNPSVAILTTGFDYTFVVALVAATAALFIASTVAIAETSSSPLYTPTTLTTPQLVEAYSSIASGLYSSSAPWNLISSYGLFRSMTTTRPEVILEGYNGTDWLPYEFRYKVGEVSRPPPTFVAPHQPRLDWQMWFAALQTYEYNPWLIHLVAKMLKGSPEVLALLDTAKNPFPSAPPSAVRARLFDYRFTKFNTTDGNHWWTRRFDRDYFPGSIKQTDVERLLQSQGWDRQSYDNYANFILEKRKPFVSYRRLIWGLTKGLRQLGPTFNFSVIALLTSFAALATFWS